MTASSEQAPHVDLGSLGSRPAEPLVPSSWHQSQVAQPQAQASKRKGSRITNRRVQVEEPLSTPSPTPTPSHRARIFTHAMPPKKRDRSLSTTPVPSTEGAQGDGAHLTQAQWEGMQKVLNHIYDYRTEE
jgi:hypothetical protein